MSEGGYQGHDIFIIDLGIYKCILIKVMAEPLSRGAARISAKY